MKWSSIANYLAGLIQCLLFALSNCDDAPTDTYDQVCNLRRQAEKLAAQDQLYKRKDVSGSSLDPGIPLAHYSPEDRDWLRRLLGSSGPMFKRPGRQFARLTFRPTRLENGL